MSIPSPLNVVSSCPAWIEGRRGTWGEPPTEAPLDRVVAKPRAPEGTAIDRSRMVTRATARRMRRTPRAARAGPEHAPHDITRACQAREGPRVVAERSEQRT